MRRKNPLLAKPKTFTEQDLDALQEFLDSGGDKEEAALAVEKFVKEVARLSREPEREYLNYFGFDDTTD